MAEKGGKRNTGQVIPLARRRCPMCGKPAAHAFRPFCSQRCADHDLGRWLTGGYRIAADEEPEFDDDQGDDTN